MNDELMKEAEKKIAEIPKSNIPSSNDILSEAKNKLREIEETNEKLRNALIENEELKAKVQIGGRSFAGQGIPEKTPQQIAEEEAAAILRMIQ